MEHMAELLSKLACVSIFFIDEEYDIHIAAV